MPVMPRKVLIFCWVILAAVGAATAAPGDNPAPRGSPGKQPPVQTGTAVSLPDAVTAADAATQQLQQMQASDGSAGEDVASGLPGVTSEIDTLTDESQRTLTPGASLDAIRNIEGKWDKIGAQLTAWTGGLTSIGTQIDKDITLLHGWRDNWNATLALANSPAAPAPPEVTQRIVDVLDTIKQTAGILQKSRTSILTLQTLVATQMKRVTDATRTAKAAEAAAVSTLWSQDSAPIWNADLRAAAGRDFFTNSHASIGAQEEQLSAYMARQWTKLVYFALILCLFAFALAHTHWRIGKSGAEWMHEDPALRRTDRILQSPIATASVLAFLCCPLLFPGAPRLFWAATAVVALAPIVILLRRLVDRHLFPVLNAVVVFYLLGQLRELAAALPILSRAILLMQTLGGALFALWFVRSTRSAEQGTTSRKTTRAAARLAAVLLLFVFIANSLGYVGLASYLGTGILAASYLAIVLYAATNILKGLAFLALQLWPLASLAMVKRHRALLRRRIGRTISLVALGLWVLRTLNLFALRKSVLDWIWRVFGAQQSLGSLTVSPGDVLGFVLAVWLSVMISRFVRFVLEEEIYDRVHIARGSSYAVTTILRYIILLVGFIVALGVLGVGMDKLTILVGAFGVGIGFGLQNIFNNFFSGIILLFERPVRVGDVIDVGAASGVVMQIGIRASKLRLADNSVLIVPNGQLISDKVTNRDVPSSRAQIDLLVRVALDSDPKRVIDVLLAVAASHALVPKDPAPEVFLKEFGVDALLFDLMCFTSDPAHAMRVQSELGVAAYAALRGAGIEMPRPKKG
jgi:potassium efflux system protein